MQGRMLEDLDKRMNSLFDAMNNGEIGENLVQQLIQFTQGAFLSQRLARPD